MKNLYSQLAAAIDAKDSPRIPKLFEMICDEVEAKLLLAAASPKTAEELAQNLNLSVEKVEEMLTFLFIKGLIYKSRVPDGIRYYRVRHVMQFHDATVLWKDAPKEYLNLWREYDEKEIPDFWRSVLKFTGKQMGRVIPISRKIHTQNQILAQEDVRAYMDKARSIAVTKCPCRVLSGTCDKPVEVCFQLGKAADYSIERGTGRAVTKEEALEIMRTAEEAGLVHVTDNRAGDLNVICNCCSCCCLIWHNAEAKNIKPAAPSRFLAEIDPETCIACGTCIEECPFDAIAFSYGEDHAEVNADECMGCGVCTILCTEEAISLKETREPAFIPA